MRRAPEFGLEQVPVQPHFHKVMERVHEIVASIAPHDSVDRYTELGVDCIVGSTAEIVDAHTVKAGNHTITTKSIIVASGARPFVPPIPVLQSIEYLTSDTVWGYRNCPRN